MRLARSGMVRVASEVAEVPSGVAEASEVPEVPAVACAVVPEVAAEAEEEEASSVVGRISQTLLPTGRTAS